MPTIVYQTKYVREDHAVLLGLKYPDGSTGLHLKSAIGEPLDTPTVNLSEYGEKPLEGNIFIRCYGAHEGSFESLHAAGVVGNAVRQLEIGPYNVKVVECPLLWEIK